MAIFTPISNTFIQHQADASGNSASGYFLKLYAASTTTPISAALDSAGSVLVAKVELDSLGFAKNGSGGSTTVYVDQTYRLVLYVNATDADNNTFANAIQDIDDIPQQALASEIPAPIISSNIFVKKFNTVADAIADTDLIYTVDKGDVLNIAGRDTLGDGGGAIWDVVPLSSVTPTTRGIIECTGVPTLAIVLRIENGIINVPSFGLAANSAVPDTALLLEVHAATGNYIQYEKDGVYICTEALKLRKGDEVNLNSAEVKFAVVGNIENFLMHTDTWLHNGTVTGWKKQSNEDTRSAAYFGYIGST